MEDGKSEYKLLRINLTQKKFEEESISEKYLEDYIGGKGLGSKYLIEEVPADCDPLGKKNKLIFVTGPLTGTMFPTASRYGIIYKSPLTGTFAESYSGGNVGRNIRYAGYFAVIIEGRSENPVYLEIYENKVDFINATELWGKDTIEIYEELNPDESKDFDILTIGPAGENLVRIASIQNNKYHSAGRCGPGALMGSKNLKAIKFFGKKKVYLDTQPKFRDFVLKKIYTKLREKPELYGKNGVYRMLGTPSIVDWANALGCFTYRYFTKGYSKEYEKINDKAIIDNVLKKRTGCTGCPFGCGKLVEVEEGEFKSRTEGPEYETLALIGGACDIMDINAIIKINDLCDRIGIDTISAGNLIGLAIESIRRGKVPKIKGIDLDYKRPLEVIKFINAMLKMEGIPGDFALGMNHVVKKYGLEELAMQVKGLGFAGYDPRQFRGFALSYGVAPEGPTHLRSVYHGIEKNLPNRLSYEGKVEPMIEQEDKMALIDSFILCKFIRAALDWDNMTELYNIIFDKNITPSDLRKIAGNMVTLSRKFNVAAGFTRNDDFMPPRAYNEEIEAPDGSKTKLDREKYAVMLNEYYEQRGWDLNGNPI